MSQSQRKIGIVLLVCLLAPAAMLGELSSVHSAPQSNSFTVNDTSDVIDANPNDGACISTEATCKLLK